MLQWRGTLTRLGFDSKSLSRMRANADEARDGDYGDRDGEPGSTIDDPAAVDQHVIAEDSLEDDIYRLLKLARLARGVVEGGLRTVWTVVEYECIEINYEGHLLELLSAYQYRIMHKVVSIEKPESHLSVCSCVKFQANFVASNASQLKSEAELRGPAVMLKTCLKILLKLSEDSGGRRSGPNGLADSGNHTGTEALAERIGQLAGSS
ncbi:hypothetical protein C8R44DRAFT_860484 [Mycena epipterygia]|nr:hypothetical protein C8R44DRAFT_860484 [Mycena epipterygia]